MADKSEEVEQTEAMEIEAKASNSEESEAEEDAEVSEDESDQDDKNEEQAAALQKSLSQNPYAYDLHTQLIELLKTMGELERLREARERMSKLFPLTEELWLSWLKDEIKLVSNDEDRAKVVALFEKAVQDYLSVDIWLEWAQFSIGGMSAENGVATVRSIFDKALTAAGLHVPKGAILWEAYREFENVMLAMHPEGSAEHEAQRNKILTLFRRQLACPLLDMEATWEELKDWAKQEEVAECKRGYDKAIEKLKQITPFEEELLRKEGEAKVAVYKNYIEHEKDKGRGEPARVQLLYERAVTDFALNPNLWLEYVYFVDCILNIAHVAEPVCERALRNVPWDSKLWVATMRAGERHEKEHIKVQGMLEQALVSGITAASDYKMVWEAYIDYLRRRVPWEEPGEVKEKRLKELRDCSARAIEHLDQLFGIEGDGDCSLAQAWARCEASRCGNMEKCRELWNDIVNCEPMHSLASTWLEFLSLERHYGDAKHVRKLFARALNATRDWPESIGVSWLSYERDQGTLDSFEFAQDKISIRTKKAAEDRAKEQANQKSSKFQNQKLKRKWEDTSKYDNQDYYEERHYEERQSRPLKRQIRGKPEGRRGLGYQERQPQSTWAKLQPSSQPAKSSSVEEKPEFKQPRAPPPPGYKSPDRDSPDNKKAKGVFGDGPVEHNSSKDNRTVFVSNLDFDTTEDEIREEFTKIGTVTDLRLVKDFKGRSKGFCYVELSTDSEGQAALKKDRDPINGRPMFVSKCDPDRQTRQKVFKYNLGMEKNKLFVKGLPLSLTQEDLQTMFGEYGTVKDVRLVTYRNGHSKGLAYIDYDKETEAAHALLKTDGKEIEGRVISVAISRPPERKQTSLLAPDIASLGGKPRDAPPTARGARIGTTTLMPRSVRLAKPMEAKPMETEPSSSANGDNPPPDDKPVAPRSNADFRAMLLGNKK